MEILEDEANTQLLLAWRRFTRAFRGQEAGELPGLSIAWGGVPYFASNALIQSTPIVSRGDLLERGARAAAYMAERRLPGILILCEDRVGAGIDLSDVPPLAPAWKMTGMVAETILPPVRELPSPAFRRVSDRKTLVDLHDINSLGYGIDPRPARASTGPVRDWLDEAFAFVAYEGRERVAAAATFPLDGRLYVAMVATVPEAQGRGYAEAVVRHSLRAASEATGLSRCVLHASDAGFPLYRRMGFEATSRFAVYR